MALKLDISFDGLNLQNVSLSAPDPMPPHSESPWHPYAGRPGGRSVTELVFPLAAPAPAPAEAGPEQIQEPQGDSDDDDAESNSSQSIVTFGSRPSSTSALTDLPLTPIPELLHTPTRHSMMSTTFPLPPTTPDYPPSRASPVEKQLRASKLPSPLDCEPILAQLAHSENDIQTIRTVRALP